MELLAKQIQNVLLVGRICIVVVPIIFTWINALSCQNGRTVSTAYIMSCETYDQKVVDLALISVNFKPLNKEHLIEKLQKALQVSSIAIIVTKQQN